MNKISKEEAELISQDEIDDLLTIAGFIEEEENNKGHSLVEEMKSAILDSGKLQLKEWHTLRRKLHEIEVLIPHIDLIIKLKEQRKKIERARTQF